MIGFCDPNHILRRTELLRYPASEGLFAQPVMRCLLLLFVLFPVVAGSFDKAGLYSRVGATNCPDYVKNFDDERAERPSPDHIRVDRRIISGWIAWPVRDGCWVILLPTTLGQRMAEKISQLGSMWRRSNRGSQSIAGSILLKRSPMR